MLPFTTQLHSSWDFPGSACPPQPPVTAVQLLGWENWGKEPLIFHIDSMHFFLHREWPVSICQMFKSMTLAYYL